jgi:hypothetical protein
MGNYSDQQATEFWVMFRKIEAQLWVVAGKVNPDYQRGQYDGWVLCPLAHATARLRCILELTPEAYPGLPGMLWLAKQQFAQVNRFHDGDDLVFAVGDVQ